MSPPGPGMVRSLASIPGATLPKMKLVTALSGICRACKAMTSASLLAAIDPWRRTIQAKTLSRRSTGAIGAPFLLVSYWRVRNPIVWPENFMRQAASPQARSAGRPGASSRPLAEPGDAGLHDAADTQGADQPALAGNRAPRPRPRSPRPGGAASSATGSSGPRTSRCAAAPDRPRSCSRRSPASRRRTPRRRPRARRAAPAVVPAARLRREGTPPRACRHLARSTWQALADIDAVAVGVGHDEAAQPVVGVAQAFDDPDPVRDQMLMQGRRIGHHEVRDVVVACPVALDQGEMHFRRVPPEDDEPD